MFLFECTLKSASCYCRCTAWCTVTTRRPALGSTSWPEKQSVCSPRWPWWPLIRLTLTWEPAKETNNEQTACIKYRKVKKVHLFFCQGSSNNRYVRCANRSRLVGLDAMMERLVVFFLLGFSLSEYCPCSIQNIYFLVCSALHVILPATTRNKFFVPMVMKQKKMTFVCHLLTPCLRVGTGVFVARSWMLQIDECSCDLVHRVTSTSGWNAVFVVALIVLLVLQMVFDTGVWHNWFVQFVCWARFNNGVVLRKSFKCFTCFFRMKNCKYDSSIQTCKNTCGDVLVRGLLVVRRRENWMLLSSTFCKQHERVSKCLNKRWSILPASCDMNEDKTYTSEKCSSEATCRFSLMASLAFVGVDLGNCCNPPFRHWSRVMTKSRPRFDRAGISDGARETASVAVSRNLSMDSHQSAAFT